VERATRAVEVFILIAVTAALALAGIGGSVATGKTPGDPHGWYVAAAFVFGSAVFVALGYFVIHPVIEALDGRRVKRLNAARAARPEPISRRRRRPSPPERPIQPAELLIPEGAIVKAEYGADSSWTDVIDIVHKARGFGDSLTVTNDTMGGDPIVNTPKVLRLTYENGALVQTNEGDTCRIREP